MSDLNTSEVIRKGKFCTDNLGEFGCLHEYSCAYLGCSSGSMVEKTRIGWEAVQALWKARLLVRRQVLFLHLVTKIYTQKLVHVAWQAMSTDCIAFYQSLGHHVNWLYCFLPKLGSSCQLGIDFIAFYNPCKLGIDCIAFYQSLGHHVRHS